MQNEKIGNHDQSQTQAKSNTAAETAETYVPELDNPITEDEVREAINKLKCGKASGLDNVCGEFLKQASHLIVPFLTKLFNKLYDSSLFPSDWCKSVIIPLFKKGDDKLWDKLEKLKTSSKMINMIQSMYCCARSCIRWGAKFSEFFECSQGVKQGCLFSPLIFSLLVSEVADFVR